MILRRSALIAVCFLALSGSALADPSGMVRLPSGKMVPAVALVDPGTGDSVKPFTPGAAVSDANNQSYTSAGVPVAGGALPAPARMPVGGAPRGVAYDCGASAANSRTTLTLSDGSTTTWLLVPNNTANQGMSATAATSVAGCTFQSLY